MTDFKLIYRILKYLQLSLDIDEPDFSAIGADALGNINTIYSKNNFNKDTPKILEEFQ